MTESSRPRTHIGTVALGAAAEAAGHLAADSSRSFQATVTRSCLWLRTVPRTAPCPRRRRRQLRSFQMPMLSHKFMTGS